VGRIKPEDQQEFWKVKTSELETVLLGRFSFCKDIGRRDKLRPAQMGSQSGWLILLMVLSCLATAFCSDRMDAYATFSG
jgi:hypothetical protein